MTEQKISFIHRYATTLYFLSAFFLSWGCVALIAGSGNLPIDGERVQDLLPLLYTSMLIGPAVGGLLFTGLTSGRPGYRDLLARLFRWRTSIHWYAIALFATPVLAILLLLALAQFSDAFQPVFYQSGHSGTLLLNGIIAGVMVGLFEELGWTGFAIPRMLQRYSVLTTGLVVGVIWGAWHFILFWEAGSFTGSLPLMILLGRLLAWLPPYRVLMIRLYTMTNSLLLVILAHVSLVVTTTVIVPMTLTGTALLTWLLSWGVILWIIMVLWRPIPRVQKR